MPSDDPSHKFTPTPPSQNEFGNPSTHTQADSIDRPGTQDALRGQGNSHARTEIPRDQVAPAQGASQNGKESYSKEDRSNVAGQPLNNQEREIPNYITTGKDESEAGSTGGPTEGKVSSGNRKSIRSKLILLRARHRSSSLPRTTKRTWSKQERQCLETLMHTEV